MRTRKAIYQLDSLPPLLFVLGLIPMLLILREVKAGYQLGDLRGKVNHLFIGNLKSYDQKKKKIDTLVKAVIIVS